MASRMKYLHGNIHTVLISEVTTPLTHENDAILYLIQREKGNYTAR